MLDVSVSSACGGTKGEGGAAQAPAPLSEEQHEQQERGIQQDVVSLVCCPPLGPCGKLQQPSERDTGGSRILPSSHAHQQQLQQRKDGEQKPVLGWQAAKGAGEVSNTERHFAQRPDSIAAITPCMPPTKSSSASCDSCRGRYFHPPKVLSAPARSEEDLLRPPPDSPYLRRDLAQHPQALISHCTIQTTSTCSEISSSTGAARAAWWTAEAQRELFLSPYDAAGFPRGLRGVPVKRLLTERGAVSVDLKPEELLPDAYLRLAGRQRSLQTLGVEGDWLMRLQDPPQGIEALDQLDPRLLRKALRCFDRNRGGLSRSGDSSTSSNRILADFAAVKTRLAAMRRVRLSAKYKHPSVRIGTSRASSSGRINAGGGFWQKASVGWSTRRHPPSAPLGATRDSVALTLRGMAAWAGVELPYCFPPLVEGDVVGCCIRLVQPQQEQQPRQADCAAVSPTRGVASPAKRGAPAAAPAGTDTTVSGIAGDAYSVSCLMDVDHEYFPAISLMGGASCSVNFGPSFRHPPPLVEPPFLPCCLLPLSTAPPLTYDVYPLLLLPQQLLADPQLNTLRPRTLVDVLEERILALPSRQQPLSSAQHNPRKRKVEEALGKGSHDADSGMSADGGMLEECEDPALTPPAGERRGASLQHTSHACEANRDVASAGEALEGSVFRRGLTDDATAAVSSGSAPSLAAEGQTWKKGGSSDCSGSRVVPFVDFKHPCSVLFSFLLPTLRGLHHPGLPASPAAAVSRQAPTAEASCRESAAVAESLAAWKRFARLFWLVVAPLDSQRRPLSPRVFIRNQAVSLHRKSKPPPFARTAAASSAGGRPVGSIAAASDVSAAGTGDTGAQPSGRASRSGSGMTRRKGGSSAGPAGGAAAAEASYETIQVGQLTLRVPQGCLADSGDETGQLPPDLSQEGGRQKRPAAGRSVAAEPAERDEGMEASALIESLPLSVVLLRRLGLKPRQLLEALGCKFRLVSRQLAGSHAAIAGVSCIYTAVVRLRQLQAKAQAADEEAAKDVACEFWIEQYAGALCGS
ncbi:hypothetical protein cyc_01673 [Cyclospora cayetanensis]|uniref:Uncharacterized protein n=1 Tax=Cyclospora cayetanensis TaxID=88456 RepID=A0A1D3D5D8_9EIME|nr:hypothetical protein cyc_01673 [Cyclospora cayetanensis]